MLGRQANCGAQQLGAQGTDNLSEKLAQLLQMHKVLQYPKEATDHSNNPRIGCDSALSRELARL